MLKRLKICIKKSYKLAIELNLSQVDSGGAFLPLQADIFPDVKHGGRSFRNQVATNGSKQWAIQK